ncbi:MAG TPA: hypothetical protein VGX23_25310 [Actinocrinis sp.]|nr:hypothetical protein [Actinocrinis sp.]
MENDRNAEDLVQIAMEKVIKAYLRNPERIQRKPTREQTEKVLYAYLARTIQNTRIDQVRKKQVIEHLKDDMPDQSSAGSKASAS